MPTLLDAQRGFAELGALRNVQLTMVIDVKDAIVLAHLLKTTPITLPGAQKVVDYYLSNLAEALDMLNCPQLARAVEGRDV